MLATNHLPKLQDVTHAFFRRLVILKFNRNFTADEMDLELSSKLRAEFIRYFRNGCEWITELTSSWSVYCA